MADLLGSIGGGIVSGIFGLLGQRQANIANANAADKANDFNQAMQEDQQDFGREMVENQEAFQTQSTAKQMDYNYAAAERQMQVQLQSQHQAQEFNRDAQQRQMDYQTQMSNTAYQRAMADMRAAGLNPMLAYGQGGATSPAGGSASSGCVSGASASAAAPAGASASSGMASGSRAQVEDFLSPAITRAFQGARIVGELEQLSSNIENTRAQTRLTGAQTQQSAAQEAFLRAQTITESPRADLLRANFLTELRRAGLVTAQTGEAQASAGLSASRQRGQDQENRLTELHGRPNWLSGPAGTAGGWLQQMWNLIGNPGAWSPSRPGGPVHPADPVGGNLVSEPFSIYAPSP